MVLWVPVAKRCTPTALSRYVKGRLLWQPKHGETEQQLLERQRRFRLTRAFSR